MKTISVDVKPDGSISIESKGYSGPECVAATRNLERALGVVEKDVKTAEYAQANTVKQGG